MTTDLLPPSLCHRQEHSDTPTQLGMSVLPRLEPGRRIPRDHSSWRWRSPVCRNAALFVFVPASSSGFPGFTRVLRGFTGFLSGSPMFLSDSPYSWAQSLSHRFHPASPRGTEPPVNLVVPAEIPHPQRAFHATEGLSSPRGSSLPSQRLSLFVSLILVSGFRINAGCFF